MVALDEFHASLAGYVRRVLRIGYDEHDTFQMFHGLVLFMAVRDTAGFHDHDNHDDYGEPEHYSYGNGGFGAIPVPAAAVAGLEKQTFRAGGIGGGVTGCSICIEDFVDGREVSVMPCPSGQHQFHPGCIAK